MTQAQQITSILQKATSQGVDAWSFYQHDGTVDIRVPSRLDSTKLRTLCSIDADGAVTWFYR